MLGPFSDKYQSIAHKQWAEMSDEEVNYIWQSNMITGIGTVIVFGLLVCGFATMSVLFNGLTWWGWAFVPFFFWTLRAHTKERQEGRKMGRLEKIEAVERIQAIRRESLP